LRASGRLAGAVCAVTGTVLGPAMFQQAGAPVPRGITELGSLDADCGARCLRTGLVWR